MSYANPEDQRRNAREHYQRNKVAYKAKAKAHAAEKRQIVNAAILEYLLSNPCITCGEPDPVVLEFDHRDPAEKRFSIAQAHSMGFSLDSVMKEIAKCNVLCANCHRRRTSLQFGWRNK